MSDSTRKSTAPRPSVIDPPSEERERRPHFTQQVDTIPPQLLAAWAAQAPRRARRPDAAAASSSSVLPPTEPVAQSPEPTQPSTSGGVGLRRDASALSRWWLAVPALALLLFASIYGASSKSEPPESRAEPPNRREPAPSFRASPTDQPKKLRAPGALDVPKTASTAPSGALDPPPADPQSPVASPIRAQHRPSPRAPAAQPPPRHEPPVAAPPRPPTGSPALEPPGTPPSATPTSATPTSATPTSATPTSATPTTPPPARSPADIDLRAKILRRR